MQPELGSRGIRVPGQAAEITPELVASNRFKGRTAVYIPADRAESPRIRARHRAGSQREVVVGFRPRALWELDALACAAASERQLVVELAAAVLPPEVFER